MEIVGSEPPTADQVRERHERLLGRLRDVAEASGHDPGRLRIVGVTKGWPVEVARTAVAAGLELLGESRVQEAEPKVEALPDVDWHFIGRLQSNKARRAVRAFSTIHSVDSVELLRRLDEIAAEEERTPRLLLQVNVSGEAAKAGIEPGAMTGQVRAWAGVDRVAGLMTIAPMGVAIDEAGAIFGRLRALRDAVEHELGRALPELSMGMTADAEAAAAEGATLVRIGTGLFGPRP